MITSHVISNFAFNEDSTVVDNSDGQVGQADKDFVCFKTKSIGDGSEFGQSEWQAVCSVGLSRVPATDGG